MATGNTGRSQHVGEDTHTVADEYDAFHQQLRARYDSLPPRLQQIADYIMAQPEDIALGTVGSLAAGAKVQPSSVVRFARTFDFNGYSDMQALFRKKLRSRNTPYRDRVNSLHAQDGAHAGAITILGGFCRAANESLDALRHINPTSLERAIGTLAAARCIYILGLRRSMPVARYMSYLLTRLEIRHHVIGLESGMEEDTMTTATSRDAAVVISFTAYAQRTIELCSALEHRRVQVVALTDSPASPVIPPSGLWLEVTEADFQGFRSNAATMVLIMALATSVAERRK